MRLTTRFVLLDITIVIVSIAVTTSFALVRIQMDMFRLEAKQ